MTQQEKQSAVETVVKESAVRVRGICRWFDAVKGYGFIQGPDNSDIFVHYSSLIEDGYKKLEDGQVVEYTPVQTPKGWAAQEVLVL